MLLENLRDVLPSIAAAEALDPDAFPAETLQALQEVGLLQAPFASQHGGVGATLPEAVAAVEALASVSGSAALIASMPLGLAGLFGAGPGVAPDAHRAHWLEQIATAAERYRAGRLYAACNSEKGAGGSLAATQTLAKRTTGGAFAISGEKILATSGTFANYFFSTAKVDPAELPGAGIVEFFILPTDALGVEILDDWDGFGMRSTESQTVRYHQAVAESMLGFPNFIELVRPLEYFFCLFAAVPLGCAGAMLRALGTPAPAGPALRLRLSEALMRYEALRAYLLETAAGWRPGAPASYGARVLRTKTYVTAESTKLCAELFALSGGRHYRRTSPVARAFADAFAGTALRPPLPLALERLSEQFELGDLGPG